MHCDVCVCREPGNGVMGQPWTIHTGTLVTQLIALAGTACSWTQLKLGGMTAVPTQRIMSVNCEQALFKYNMNAQ